MNIYEFSGFGNYSESFGWDNGLSTNLGNETSFEEAQETERYAVANGSCSSFALPSSPEEGVFEYFRNEHGGSRNVRGHVIAATREDAEELLLEFEQSFRVVEYEG